MVHIAMEKCLVGEMVYLAFRLTNTNKNTSQMQPNVLPISKATNFNTYCKIPELLANGIRRVQNERKHRSIADVLMEYLGHFEVADIPDSGRITGDCAANDCSHSVAKKENTISTDEMDCNIHDAVSPRNLLGANSNRNNFVLLLSSDNESKNNVDVSQDLSFGFGNIQRSACIEHDRVEGNSSESGESRIICNKNLTLSDLQQSFCCNTNDPCMWTSIREDSPSSGSLLESLTPKGTLFSKGVSEKENLKPVCPSTSAADVCSKSGVQSYVVKIDGNSCEAACGNDGTSGRDKDLELPGYNEFDMMFDSPTSEDLDAFLAEISLTRLSTKPEEIDENQNQSCYKVDKRCSGESGQMHSTSHSNIICCDHEPKTCLTSTPSLASRNYRKASDLEGVICSSFSPIYSEFIATSSERHSNDMEKNSLVYDDSRAMFPTTGNQQSKFGLSSTPVPQFGRISNCLCSSISRNTTGKKSPLKISSRIKGKKKTKNLLKCISSLEKSKKSQLKNVVNVSQEYLDNSPDSCTPLVRGTTPHEKCTENSLLLFEDKSYVNCSKEEAIESRDDFQDSPVNSLPACTKSVDAANRNKECLKNNGSDGKLSSTYGSPLLFSP